MEYIYAALLLDAVGKEVTEENLERVIKATGIEPDQAMVKAVVTSLKGVNIKEVIKNAQNVAPQAPQATTSAQPQNEAEKKESKKSEEESVGGLASLFG
ncbi:MAG: 50S ribosomal protein P1 [Candidatus Micrarchaeaceae archaeon]